MSLAELSHEILSKFPEEMPEEILALSDAHEVRLAHAASRWRAISALGGRLAHTTSDLADASTTHEDVFVIGGAREALQKHGAWDGREEDDLDVIIRSTLDRKRMSTEGSVSQLCISPANGARLPCNHVVVRQSLMGDCQSLGGLQQAPGQPELVLGADQPRLKNAAGQYLEEQYLFIEALLSGISVGDGDLVSQVVSGPKSDRVLQSPVHAAAYSQVWCTGDNMYVEGIDLSWDNFGVGDLLVTPEVVVLNTGYPHHACWKYAARCGSEAREYVNDEAGIFFRLRGFKGAVLLPPAMLQSVIRTHDKCFIVRRDSEQYAQIVRSCRTPLQPDTEVRFQLGGTEWLAAAEDTLAYVDLMVSAGCEAGRIDARKYRRPLSELMSSQLGIVAQSSKL
jgi:hypothetical protein